MYSLTETSFKSDQNFSSQTKLENNRFVFLIKNKKSDQLGFYEMS
jgi:hypothetical protein